MAAPDVASATSSKTTTVDKNILEEIWDLRY